jgi:hypothetical protein
MLLTVRGATTGARAMAATVESKQVRLQERCGMVKGRRHRKRWAHPRDMARLIEVLGEAFEAAHDGISRDGEGRVWVSDETKLIAAVEWGVKSFRQYNRVHGDGQSWRRG